jgi:hypothetical protein
LIVPRRVEFSWSAGVHFTNRFKACAGTIAHNRHSVGSPGFQRESRTPCLPYGPEYI